MELIAEDRLAAVAGTLYVELYEAEFAGFRRGRFRLDREQLKRILGLAKLCEGTVAKLQAVALQKGLAIIDLDDAFACVETSVLRTYRQVPGPELDRVFGEISSEEVVGDFREEEDRE
jgi:hypothetical protein